MSFYLFGVYMYPKGHLDYPKGRYIHSNITHNSRVSGGRIGGMGVEIALDGGQRLRLKRGIFTKMLVQSAQNALPRALRQKLRRVRNMTGPTLLDIGRINLRQSRISSPRQPQTKA